MLPQRAGATLRQTIRAVWRTNVARSEPIPRGTRLRRLVTALALLIIPAFMPMDLAVGADDGASTGGISLDGVKIDPRVPRSSAC